MATKQEIKAEIPEANADEQYLGEEYLDEEEQDSPPKKRAKLEIGKDEGSENRETETTPIKASKSPAKSKSKKSKGTDANAEEKYKHRDEHNLSGYNKRQILNYLRQHGSSERAFEAALGTFKVPKNIALEFFNKQVADAQEHVYQECDSLSFENITAWLRLFEAWQLPQQCAYELPVVMNAIANNEPQPAPSEVAGVDLKAVYKFLGNSLLGLPQPELSAVTAEFLADEFEMLINDANTNTADMETRELKQKLQSSPPPPPTSHHKQKFSLDPLLLDDTI